LSSLQKLYKVTTHDKLKQYIKVQQAVGQINTLPIAINQQTLTILLSQNTQKKHGFIKKLKMVYSQRQKNLPRRKMNALSIFTNALYS
jgi:hypothetical protein